MSARLALPAVLVAGLGTLTACSPPYGASFGYPDAPPVPSFAAQTDASSGSDDDDPMRGRSVVVDIGEHAPADLVAFYRERFPATAGWRPGTPDADVGGQQLLCLVSNAHDDYDEYVEVEEAEDGRYEVFVNRLHVSPARDERTVDRCGLGSIWYSTA